MPAPDHEDKLIEAALQQEYDQQPVQPAIHRLPKIIGSYRILRRIGVGGMGVVYEAEQTEPTRRVALKVIRMPAGSDSHHARLFHREIQVLARLRHPSIAQIYDAGQTDDGQQYFVMELIDGQSLTEYCDIAELSLRDRLALFAKVCGAVNYAHQRGVIHRDLKPANILVDAEGTPHVLDFGLARFIDPEMEVTRSLQGGQAMVGTLPYMSPEQTRADAADIDIRTDVYSLGVILYEMLTDRYPYEVVGQLADVLRNIAEAEPARPSSVHRRINDEVETIVIRTLAKDRDRRYQSAEALAQDVQRYLDGEPIEAKRDSALYVIRKLALRHRYAAALLTTSLVTVLSFAAISFEFWRREQGATAELARTNQIVAEENKQLEAVVANVQEKVGRQALAWFLLEWHQDRLDRAREIRDHLSPNSVESVVADFLLDESCTVEALRARLPTESGPLVDFMAGERYCKADRHEEAIEVLERCLATASDGWLIASAKARLRQLRSESVSALDDGAR